ncbi:TetR/AcrR family transcriptional regulator [Bailinhaonella thermotolerans]|uniref:TetR/AcrR family transcriptional regulator n=1 Tax=Bailinhaonella thermotolerans TaxID=1070861 RepID=A0A3A4B304_9ACTN|nr:TetR/AcrR family transcriptional regulator [Bailinhaonella thermotolerans]RJL32555.1 TetR/AcrR family transcriptional regulator [Bailinhaonella thermotolerans]
MDTRAKIQAVARRLLAEKGYDATSLREIAEEVGVTKAALYYHFKTKEEIVASVFEGFLARLDELLDWGESRPPGRETRREMLTRYSRLVREEVDSFRFVQQVPAALQRLDTTAIFEERMRRFNALLREPGDTLEDSLRKGLAVHSIHFAWSIVHPMAAGGTLSEDEYAKALLNVTLGMVDPS